MARADGKGPHKQRLDELEAHINEMREEEEREQRKAARQRMRFATPEAYAGEMMHRGTKAEEDSSGSDRSDDHDLPKGR